ncbi:hypothetical protein F9C07_1663755 [Aspergillus flavus]|uniref:Secreted protein n=1 Tax=Aspergillus flavus (strain ATCC 200026 / FGSC A1120 / IAM 13836 / NRRL 3357 / JCM 12722 / SRRC 167) TaxID=332952 RepID=A0A7U2MI81_ASPFN|nr:hypothetical protein F9C07_1663755 [Aspergillus flavus]
MDKQTTGWWILLAFSLRLAFLLSLASDQLTLAGCSLDGLALWAPLRLVPVVPVDRAFVGACLSPLSLSLFPVRPFPSLSFSFCFSSLGFHSTLNPFLLLPSSSRSFDPKQVSASLFQLFTSLSIRSPLPARSIVSCDPVSSDRPTDLIHSLFLS